MASQLSVLSFGMDADWALLASLRKRLQKRLGWTVRRAVPWFELKEHIDPVRHQASATGILQRLLDEYDDGRRFLAVVDVDLFVPVLSYVFGEAQLSGRAAIVSGYRLRPERYGLPHDPALLGDRLLKESVHELGHTLGLVHCRTPGCVMRSATAVDEIDLKTEEFCPACAGWLSDRE